ncbi:hypothetical protein PHMEG_00039099 [Phytophthora megakarya]|uniref:Uncharacterized protein n=1 Tax=Phytophthora megakarya TaxID=4795 RepID=A0A225UG81_9STRA|nr:hypothetical protein PHMEG_00039099 [Phytophthora megakarya]
MSRLKSKELKFLIHALDLAAKGCLCDDTMCTVARKLFDKDDNVTFVNPSILGIVLNGLVTVNTEEIRTILRSSRSEFILIPVNFQW